MVNRDMGLWPTTDRARFDRWIARLGGYDSARYRAIYREAFEFGGQDGCMRYLEMAMQADEDHAAEKRQRAARTAAAVREARTQAGAATEALRRATELKLAVEQLAAHPRLVELAADADHRHIPGTDYEWRHGFEPLTEAAAESHFGKVPAGWHAPGARREDSAAAAAVRRSTAPRHARGGVDAKGRPTWPLARVGRLKSGNVPGLTVEQEYQLKAKRGRYTRDDFEVAKAAGSAHPRDYQADITNHIGQHGIINPVQASYGHLDEGYHRYAAARQLGMRSMPVSAG